ncbi:hypothetical protein HDU81_010578, partial [Chytriomyces hyalinus]
YCKEMHGIQMGIKGSCKPEFNPLVAAQTGTETQIIKYLRCDHKDLKTKHEKECLMMVKGNPPATDPLATTTNMDPSSTSSSKLKTKSKAQRAEEVDSEHSADKPDVETGTKPPAKKLVMSRVVKYLGKLYNVQ